MTREARHIIDKKSEESQRSSWSAGAARGSVQARKARLGVTLFNLEGVRREIEGDIAQLGERLPCKQEVAGSNPTISTKRISVTPVIQIVSKPSEVGLKRRGGARERTKFSAEPETEKSGLCDDEGP